MKEFMMNNKAVTIAICGVIIAALAFATVLVANNAAAGNQSYISVEAAKSAALNDAGVKEKNATFTKTALDEDDGTPVYDVEFYTRNAEYDYEINATSGQVSSKSVDMDKRASANQNNNSNNTGSSGSASGGSGDYYSGSSSSSSSSSGEYIGVAKAKSIALGRAGIGSATWIEAHLDYDDGRAVYELEFLTSKYEFDAEIDAITGAILDFDRDYRDWDDD